MKKVILSISVIVTIAIVLIACDKAILNENKDADQVTTSQLKSVNDNVTIVCNGNCTGTTTKCSLMGPIAKEVSCSCSGCSMTVTKTKNGITTVTNLVGSNYKVNYIDLFKDYMDLNYSNQEYSITKYNLQESEEVFVETYFFETEVGVTQTIILVGDAQGLSDKVKIYDCTGTCNCTETYTMSTGSVTCSCTPCSLKVTTVKTK